MRRWRDAAGELAGNDASTGEAGALGIAGAGTAGAAAATAAALCCTGPVLAPIIVGILGAGGAAWAAGLKPYSPYLLAVSGILLAYTFRTAYRTRERCARPSTSGARRPWKRRLPLGVAWSAALVWVAAVMANVFLG